MTNLGSSASSVVSEATSLSRSISDSDAADIKILPVQERYGEDSSTGRATSLQMKSENPEMSKPAAKNFPPPPQGQIGSESSAPTPTPYQKSAKAPRIPVKTAPASTSAPTLPALPKNTPIHGHRKVIIDNHYHTFVTHECDKIFHCPLIPPGTPNESRDTATRNHRSRHTIAKNWGVQLETLLRRAEDKMQLPPKYAKHLLSNLALLSNRVQDPSLALELLAKAYVEHRTVGDTSMLRVQDVKNTLEALDRASGRGAETRSGTVIGPASSQSATPAPTAAQNTRPRAPRSVQFDTSSKTLMPPPPTPLSKSKRSQLRNPPRQTGVEKDSPSASPSPEEKGSATPPIPTHSRNTRAAGARGDCDLRTSATYFLPADPEPPRKKRATGISKAKLVIDSGVSLLTAPVGATGTVGGVRMWNGKRIFDPDIGDIAASYYGWQTSQLDKRECRRQIEKRREEDADRELQRQARASEAVEKAASNNFTDASEASQNLEVDKDGDMDMNETPVAKAGVNASETSADKGSDIDMSQMSEGKDDGIDMSGKPEDTGSVGLTTKSIEDTTSEYSSPPTSPVLSLDITSTQTSVIQSESEATQESPMTDAMAKPRDADMAIHAPDLTVVATIGGEPIEKSSIVSATEVPAVSIKPTKDIPTMPIPVSPPVAQTRGPFASVLSLMGFASLHQEAPATSMSS